METLLLVVDMQNDFIDGALGTPEAQAVLPAAAISLILSPTYSSLYSIPSLLARYSALSVFPVKEK